MTNATSGEQPAQTREEQKQAEGEEEQAMTGEELKQTGEEETNTSPANATAAETPSESLNTTNVTSMLNSTDSADENSNPEDNG